MRQPSVAPDVKNVQAHQKLLSGGIKRNQKKILRNWKLGKKGNFSPPPLLIGNRASTAFSYKFSFLRGKLAFYIFFTKALNYALFNTLMLMTIEFIESFVFYISPSGGLMSCGSSGALNVLVTLLEQGKGETD